MTHPLPNILAVFTSLFWFIFCIPLFLKTILYYLSCLLRGTFVLKDELLL